MPAALGSGADAPEDFSRFFKDADQSHDAALSPLRAYFPVTVIQRLRASSVPAPPQ